LEQKSEPPLVLVVDDVHWYRRALAQALTRETGVRVLQAENGLEALDLITKHAADLKLVVADERYPTGMSGTMLLDEVGRRWPKIRRCLLSAYTTGEMVAGSPFPVVDKAIDWWALTNLLENMAYERDDP
jgi:CheY-like chemotaxis protein